MNSKTLAGFAAVIVVTLAVWHFMRSSRSPEPSPVRGDSGTASAHTTNLPRRPAPPLLHSDRPLEEVTDNLQSSNILSRLAGDDLPKLTLEQVEAYLRENHRSAESLLGAFYCTREKSLLDEAKQKFPNDPRVAFVAATQLTDSPEEQRKWLDTFKQLAPNNALADYLSAADYFNSGHTDVALQEVQAAVSKPLQNFELDFLQNNQEAYRAAGYSEVEARTIASMSLMIPEMSSYKKVGVSLVDLAKAYQQAGDTASAQASLQLALGLSQRLDEPGALTLLQTLVGMSIERKALSAMDPNGAFDGTQTVQGRLDTLKQQRDSIKSLVNQWETFKPRMSDQDVMNFNDRRWRFGELSAFEWAVKKYGTPAATYP